MNFKNLHYQNTPILICNVWDVASAKVAKKLNFQAIGTSSGAIANMLGYKDGEGIPFEELKYIIQRISATVDLPLSIDLEAGYSRDPIEIVNHIERLVKIGVIGINIEDSLVTDKRRITDTDVFTKKLKIICEEIKSRKIEVFINVRTDAFLLNLSSPIQETIKRAKQYKHAGADGIFIPCIEKADDIKSIIEEIELPINVMCMPNLPNFEILKSLGVKRISMGNFLHQSMLTHFETELKNVVSLNSFEPIFR